MSYRIVDHVANKIAGRVVPNVLSSLWTPAQITTEGWYDAADASTITDSGGSVSQWDTKSGNGEHLVQAVGASQPTTGTRTINGLNVLDSDSLQFLEKTSYPVPASGDLAVFMVAEIDSLALVTDCIISMNSASKDWQFQSGSETQFDGKILSTVASNLDFTGGPFPGPSIFEVAFDYAGAGTVEGFVDGTSRGSLAEYNVSKIDTSQHLRVFSNRNGTRQPNGAFGEVIIIEDVTQATREKIEGYLAHKWGLEANLPGGHPYKAAAPRV